MPAEKEEKQTEEENNPHKQDDSRSHIISLLEWTAPGRPFRKRGRQYYLTALLIMIFLEVILFLFSQYVLMILVVSVVFVGFALSSVPPRNFQYKISSEGVLIEDRFFLWQELYDFYARRDDGVDTIRIRTQAYFPGELTLTLGDMSEEKVKHAILPYLPFREYIKPTFVEKAADWLSKNFPLESK